MITILACSVCPFVRPSVPTLFLYLSILIIVQTFKVCLVIDELFNVPSKIIHVRSDIKLADEFQKMEEHFQRFGSPVMMGGDMDASSKGVFGTLSSADGKDKKLLILDPHYWGKEVKVEKLISDGWAKWVNCEDFLDSSFYNLCLPQIDCRRKS